ncbi:MAG: hypothetical protein K8T25_19360 [Planctomycetia bacterium]|nr:hypothetical protein [Planctomycetia bacterium]
MAETENNVPHCPKCSAAGMGHISWQSNDDREGEPNIFNVVFCTRCGHVYGITPAIVDTMSSRITREMLVKNTASDSDRDLNV